MKTKIDDAMIDRARQAMDPPLSAAEARGVLDAALNPPDGPMIVVTRRMTAVGWSELIRGVPQLGGIGEDHLERAYRAMRALEPKELVIRANPVLTDDGAHHRRKDDSPHITTHLHRRHDDPRRYDFRTYIDIYGPGGHYDIVKREAAKVLHVHHRKDDLSTRTHRREGDAKL